VLLAEAMKAPLGAPRARPSTRQTPVCTQELLRLGHLMAQRRKLDRALAIVEAEIDHSRQLLTALGWSPDKSNQ